MGNGTSSKSVLSLIPPPWIHTIRPNIQRNRDGFGSKSQGFRNVTINTIIRRRKGNKQTDGAKWIEGYNSGKHVFEIVFPSKMRGKHSSIGVGTKDSELDHKSSTSLVGKAAVSWGIDLSTQKVFVNGRLTRRYPRKLFSKLPDVFFMYLDMDKGKIMFGSEEGYFGPAIQDEDMRRYTVYPMVSATEEGAVITMAYKGKGIVLSSAGILGKDGHYRAWKSIASF
ncbi:protein gustavus-like [Mytilus californianus]|uniref:protein gustavus-like n=1 Tax=Mytilus californianus TaxID=6549 RepID=UPI00224782CB|nr:protein gustavus-like [Mytilus californianus]XP_052093729.1 protein gustavus-like [Mytilus californianus]